MNRALRVVRHGATRFPSRAPTFLPRSSRLARACLLGVVGIMIACNSDSMVRYPGNAAICDGIWVDTQINRQHCGECDSPCSDGLFCVSGACTCRERWVLCGGGCIDPKTDRQHCGASADCSGAQGGIECDPGKVCAAGACALACQEGLVDCEGTCVDPRTSPSHCGASGDCAGPNAGMTCGEGKACDEGACSPNCQAGRVDCDGKCIDPSTDHEHCGVDPMCQHGTSCQADAVCIQGACLSNDARLLSLTTSSGPVIPAFDPERLAYSVSTSGFLLTITPTSAVAGASIRVNGIDVTSGEASPGMVVASPTPITVEVTAPGGRRRSYGISALGTYAPYPLMPPSDPKTLYGRGAAVSISGDTLAVAAPPSSGSNADGAGGVYVYVRSNNHWSLQEHVPIAGLWPGAISLSGDTLAVPFSDPSIPYPADNDRVAIYKRSGKAWYRQAVLAPPFNPDSRRNFGAALSLDGDTLAVGAHEEASSATGVNGDSSDASAPFAGAVFVFARSGDTWSQQAYIKASNAEANDYFGVAISLSGDRLAIGAVGEDSCATGVDGDQFDNSCPSAGAVYVFARSGGSWFQQAYLKSSSGDRYFGSSLSLHADILAVGSLRAVSVFDGAGATWALQALLRDSELSGYLGHGYGYKVSLADKTLAVGMPDDRSGGSGVNGDPSEGYFAYGSVLLLVRSGSSWLRAAYIHPSYPLSLNSHLGVCVLLSEDSLVTSSGVSLTERDSITVTRVW